MACGYGVRVVGLLGASIITDKLPLFYLASCFPLLKYSVELLLTVSNTVSNSLMICTRGSWVRCCACVVAAVAAWAGFPGVGQGGGKGGAKKQKILATRPTALLTGQER